MLRAPDGAALEHAVKRGFVLSHPSRSEAARRVGTHSLPVYFALVSKDQKPAAISSRSTCAICACAALTGSS